MDHYPTIQSFQIRLPKIGVGGWVGNEINARMENASERKQTTL